MTVYAYARVSTLQQANDGDSLEAQVKQVQGYASSRGLDLHEDAVFVEKGVSGGQEFGSRPAGSKLLASLTSGDIVIFPKLDRGFRNTRDALNVLHKLKEIGVSVHSIDLGGDVTGNGVGAGDLNRRKLRILMDQLNQKAIDNKEYFKDREVQSYLGDDSFAESVQTSSSVSALDTLNRMMSNAVAKVIANPSAGKLVEA